MRRRQGATSNTVTEKRKILTAFVPQKSRVLKHRFEGLQEHQRTASANRRNAGTSVSTS